MPHSAALAKDPLTRARQDLEELAYAASHDLREPVRAVGSFAALLKEDLADGRLGPREAAYLDHLVSGARRLQAQIDGLTEYSRASRPQGPKREVDLESLVAAVLSDLPDDDARTASVEVGALPMVWGCPRQYHRLLEHLLHNAITYRSDRPLRLAVSATTGGDMATISIRDNGIGIPNDQLERVLRPFQSLHPERRRGVGMGLPVSRRIVEEAGGALWLESGPAGTTVFFRVPLAQKGAG